MRIITSSIVHKELNHNLISPFQLRVNQIIVNEAPLMTLLPTSDIPDNAYSIVIGDHNLIIPLQLNGIMSYFPTHFPTKDELEHPELYPQIHMTYDSPTWDPYDTEFSRIKQSCRDQMHTSVHPSKRYLDSITSQRSELDERIASLEIKATSSVRRKGQFVPRNWQNDGK
jgi:hypothetical protein